MVEMPLHLADVQYKRILMHSYEFPNDLQRLAVIE
jgi:hypothetical protein